MPGAQVRRQKSREAGSGMSRREEKRICASSATGKFFSLTLQEFVELTARTLRYEKSQSDSQLSF